jgi:hypothetical protein
MGFGMTESYSTNCVTAGSYLAASDNTITISGYIPSSKARFSKILPEIYQDVPPSTVGSGYADILIKLYRLQVVGKETNL